MSSAGLRELLGTLKEARRSGGDFRLAAIQDNVRQMLDMTGFSGSLIRAFAQQHYSLNLIDMLGDDKAESGGDKADGLSRLRRTPPSIGANALKNAVMLTNNYIANNHGESNMFATLFFAVLDPATGLFNYINAGHNPPLIVGLDGVKTQLASTGPAIGLLPDLEFGIQQARRAAHDTLLIYTDGITEARAPNQTLFSDERLLALLAQPTASAADMLARVKTSVRRHIAEADQSDDITMLAIRRV